MNRETFGTKHIDRFYSRSHTIARRVSAGICTGASVANAGGGIVQAETVARGLEHRSLCIPRARPGSIGKIMRVNPDGSVPKDNPFVGRSGVLPEIWSYGHRNVQAAALHPRTGQLWTAEHGARGGNELNHPEAGKNYGWPVITYGVDYSGAMIGEGTAKPGMEQPVYYWDPVIAQRRREYRQAL